MSARTIRTLALTAGAAALVVSAAAPAMAVDLTVDKLPANVKLAAADQLINVAIPQANQPVGFQCGLAANVTWTAFVPGKQDAVLLDGKSAPVTLTCANNTLSFVVSANNASRKKNAVVKVVATTPGANVDDPADDTKAVLTLVVHKVKTAKAPNANKPA